MAPSATFQTTARASSPVGTYPIAATIADPDGRLGNYAVANTTGTLTIGAAESVATAAPVTAREGETVLLSVRPPSSRRSRRWTRARRSSRSLAPGRLFAPPTRSRCRRVPPASKSRCGSRPGEYTLAVVYGGATNSPTATTPPPLTLANAPPVATFAARHGLSPRVMGLPSPWSIRPIRRPPTAPQASPSPSTVATANGSPRPPAWGTRP
ncbi:MAG: hypothetical protein U0232_03325 [Thermomicrobiales bacterium]